MLGTLDHIALHALPRSEVPSSFFRLHPCMLEIIYQLEPRKAYYDCMDEDRVVGGFRFLDAWRVCPGFPASLGILDPKP